MTKVTQTIKIGHVERIITGARTIVNKDGKTFVDGKPIEELDLGNFTDKEINIYITGDIDKLEVDCCNKIEVNGQVRKVDTTSGDVEVKGDVTGDIETLSGDINCGSVGGDISTMSGDIIHK